MDIDHVWTKLDVCTGPGADISGLLKWKIAAGGTRPQQDPLVAAERRLMSMFYKPIITFLN